MVVSNMFYFHPYLGKIPILTSIFQMANQKGLELKKYCEMWGFLLHLVISCSFAEKKTYSSFVKYVHQKFQVPKNGGTEPYKIFKAVKWVWDFPYISHIHTAYMTMRIAPF